MSRKITLLIGFVALVGLAALLGGRGALAQGTGIEQSDAAVSLYWYERTDDVLLKGNADGSGSPVTCLTITNDVRGLAIDSAGGKLYWLERDTNRLRRANVNCSGAQILSEALVNPDRLALDLSAGRIYWTENDGSNRIRRANLDGSNVVTVLSDLGTPVGVAVDSANGFLYWTELDPPAVWRSTLGGTNKVKVVPLATGSGPLDVVVDAPRGRILWINSGQGAIYTAGLDGSNPVVWLDLPDPRYVIVDQDTGQVYWGDHDTGEIRRANANGSNNQLLFSTTDGVFQPRGLSLYYTSGVTCYSLTRTHSGQGSDPTATPNKSTGCGVGQYVEGESISLSATPAAGWRVAGWSGTNNDGSTSTANTVTMPAGNHTVSVTYEQAPITCYSLTRTHSGQGSDPVATPNKSTGCNAGQYVAGEVISLAATPAAGWRVAGWSGTNNDGSTSTANTVTMPAGNRTVSVFYEQIPITCFALTRGHSGQGSDPVATPNKSTGCGAGQYVAGEVISLAATPAAGWRVAGWSGTNNDGSTSTANTVTMPAGNHAVSVLYEQTPILCYSLTRGHSGQGNDPIATPAHSAGCGTGQYVAGENISLSATPAAGWRVAGWSGTNNDGSNSTANTVTMPAGNHAVSVLYEQAPIVCYSLTRGHSGQGGDPVATPAHSAGCGTGQFVAGEVISLTATPAAGWHVAGWSGTDNDGSASTTNAVTMPANGHAVSVSYDQTPPPCYTLTRTHTGQGSDPIAAPARSTGCGTGQYVAGEVIALTATPAAGWRVAGWSGTNNDGSASTTNAVAMPAAARTVAVNYVRSVVNTRVVLPAVLNQNRFLGPREIEPNNRSSEANGPLMFNRSYQGFPNDLSDYYSFELTSARQFTVDLTNITGKDPQLQLYFNSTATLLDLITAPPYRRTYDGAPGRYYVRVVVVAENNSTTLYTLRIEAAGAE